MGGAIGEGYATTMTDAGLGDAPDSWALKSQGNVNLASLHNLGYRSLNDQAIISKDLVRSFYGVPPTYSYWSGCSQGGRQGLMLAQRYPHAYDGIAAAAPAQSWPEFVSAVYHPLLARVWAGEPSPLACELDFLTEKAVKHCDPLDGIVDGIISDVERCDFDPFGAVNTTFPCSATGNSMPLTRAAAITSQAAWSGPRTVSGDFLWYGVNPGSDISGLGILPGQNDTASPDEWLSLFLLKNQSADVTKLSHEEYDRLFHLAVQEYTDVMAANDPDLTEFKKAGGKLLTYHGMVSH
jgi:feruloyl esterase